METSFKNFTNTSVDIDLELHESNKIPFPWKLHQMLNVCENNGLSHIVSWLPDNRSFRVHQTDVFVKNVIMMFFKQTKYKSVSVFRINHSREI